MKGKDLLNELVGASKLPEDLITKEVLSLIDKNKLSKDSIELEDLRLAMAQYLQEVILKAKKQYS